MDKSVIFTIHVIFQKEENYQQRKCYPAVMHSTSLNDVTIIKVNDCVLFRMNNDEPTNVGKISSIWMDEKNYIRLSLFRFYRLVKFNVNFLILFTDLLTLIIVLITQKKLNLVN